MYNFRIFFKMKDSPADVHTCKHIEMEKETFEHAFKESQEIAEKEGLRVVMIAELSKRFQ